VLAQIPLLLSSVYAAGRLGDRTSLTQNVLRILLDYMLLARLRCQRRQLLGDSQAKVDVVLLMAVLQTLRCWIAGFVGDSSLPLAVAYSRSS